MHSVGGCSVDNLKKVVQYNLKNIDNYKNYNYFYLFSEREKDLLVAEKIPNTTVIGSVWIHLLYFNPPQIAQNSSKGANKGGLFLSFLQIAHPSAI